MNTTYEYAGVILNAKMVETFIPKLLKSNVKKQKNSEIEIISIEKEETSNMIDSCKNKDLY